MDGAQRRDADIRAEAFGLERRAIDEQRRADMRPTDHEIALSHAISARRHAEALEAQARHMALIAEHLRTLAGELAHPEWGIAAMMRRKS